MKVPKAKLEELFVNTIRFLATDAVEKAQSGHPGAPMGMAPLGYALWTQFLKHNPKNPQWPDRDRFVLSAGHACMLQYSLLYLTGYDVSLDDIKQFRQWGSKTPGHPEYRDTPGVETTTGPLGQGFATSVGMAMAERFLSATFNKPGHAIVDHYTYCIASDGDLMEGVASEAASLAGHIGLGKLICFYDDNKITIEGDTKLAFTGENVGKRFEAYGWQVLEERDGTNIAGITKLIQQAQAEKNRPSLIIVHTHIAYGSPHKQDTAAAHGAPLGAEEVKATKENLGWPLEPSFYVPDEAMAYYRQAVPAGAKAQKDWEDRLAQYAKAYPDLARDLENALRHKLPGGWDKNLPVFTPKDGAMATRSASGAVLNAIAAKIPNLIGGSADLAPSNDTNMKGMGDFLRDNPKGRNLHFGVREHAMGAAINGMALHGGVIPFGATFFIFTDYMRPAIRLAAIMRIPSIFIYTHDSIGLGEDGPTHQPIEHLMTMRDIPNLTLIRPADANETREALRVAINSTSGPVCLVLTRQKLPVLDPAVVASAEHLQKGAYVLADCAGKPDVLLLASGSEVALAMGAKEKLAAQNMQARVISMPSWDLFATQPKEYRDKVLPPDVKKRLSIEAGITRGWTDYVGCEGDSIGINRFGASAPGNVLMEKFGFTVDNVVQRALALLEK